MVSLYRTFAQALQWNTLECIVYQILFLAHQIAFFSHTSPTLYGLVGTLFSFVYLIVFFGNGGLDASLAPFFPEGSTSQQSFKRLIASQLGGNLIINGVILAIVYLFNTMISVSPLLYGILCLLVLSESLKKTVRTLLHLAFLNKATALLEIISISTYTASVWSIYYVLGYFTVYTIFVPMLLVSSATTTVLLVLLYNWYKQLPFLPYTPGTITLKRLLSSRFFTSAYTFGHIVFSSNFIVPFCAVRFGLEVAGSLKLISTISYTITAIMHRIFGFSIDALFIRITNLPQSEQEAFTFATEIAHHMLYGIVLFLSINYHKISAFYAKGNFFLTTSAALIFLIVMLSEHLFTVYEKFYLSKERADILMFLHSIVSVSAYLAITVITWPSPSYMLSVIAAMRLGACVFLAWLSFYQWQVFPSFHLRPTYMAAALSLALLFFMCV